MRYSFSRKIFQNTAVSGTVVVTLGLFLGSVFSYLLQLTLGRLLNVSDFGTFNTLLSLFLIVAVLSSTLSTALIKLVTDLKAEGKFDTLTLLFKNVTFFLLSFGLIVFLGFWVVAEFLSGFLRIYDILALLSFGAYVGFSFVIVVSAAYLQGLLRFKAFAFWSALTNFLRFLFPAILVLMGFGLAQVFMGMSLGIIVSYLISLVLLSKNFAVFEKVSLNTYYKRLLVFAGTVLFVQLGSNLLSNVDMLLVKHFFMSETAGIYAGVVTVGKIILFGAGSVGVVMFPQISEAFAKKENYIAKFKPLFALQLLFVVGGVLVFSVFPGFITTFMFGAKYAEAIKYIPLFSMFIGAYVLVNFMTLFFLAIEKTRVVLFQIPAVLLQIILITLFHASLRQVIIVNLCVVILLLVFLVLYYFLCEAEKKMPGSLDRGDSFRKC